MISIIPPLIIISGFFSVASILWDQEFKHYVPVGDHSELKLNVPLEFDFISHERPSYLHFFSEDCRSARINISHIKRIISTYENSVDFYIINNSSLSSDLIHDKYDVPSNTRIIDDASGQISRSLKVKTLPYALITRSNKELYFAGNYNNKNGLCGANDIIWSSPAVALKSIIKNNHPPIFLKHQLNFVGCTIQ